MAIPGVPSAVTVVLLTSIQRFQKCMESGDSSSMITVLTNDSRGSSDACLLRFSQESQSQDSPVDYLDPDESSRKTKDQAQISKTSIGSKGLRCAAGFKVLSFSFSKGAKASKVGGPRYICSKRNQRQCYKSLPRSSFPMTVALVLVANEKYSQEIFSASIPYL